MFHLLAVVISGLLGGVVDWIFPSAASAAANGLWSSLPHNVVGAAVAACAVFGLFIDLPLFFGCVGVLLTFRSIWLVYRVYMTIKQAIPVVG